MDNRKSKFVTACVIIGIILAIIIGISECSPSAIKIESEKLITDYTCYKGNNHCPKVSVTIKNTSNSSYYVYLDVNFYYKGELACSESSEGITLSGKDSYTFVIQSSVGTRFASDPDNWSYKITNFQALKQ